MQIGIGHGPQGAPEHQSTHYIYDSRSGMIVALFHFAGATPKSEAARREELLRSAQESTHIPHEHLAILESPEVPPGEGELRVDHATRQLVRKSDHVSARIRI